MANSGALKFADDLITGRVSMEEFATRAKSPEYFNFWMYLPDPDPILRKLGQDVRVYRELLSDSRVGPCVESRKAAVICMQKDIERGQASARVSKFIQDMFTRLPMDQIIRDILNAPLFGCQPLEILWQREGSYVVPGQILGKPVEWFIFNPENEIRMRTKEHLLEGVELPPRKFLLARYNATYANPYGERVLSRCFWPVKFKQGGMRFWMRFLEKFGSPYLVGRHPRGAGDKEIDDLAQSLEAAIQDAVIVVPDDSRVEILEPGAKSSSGKLYSELKAVCDDDIAICILGQNLTTSVHSGSLAAAQVHERVRREIKDGDRDIVVAVMTQLIDWTCEINFGPGPRPIFKLYEEEEVDQALATRDQVLASTGQVRFTKKYFLKAYGFEEEDFEIVADASKPDNIPNPDKSSDFNQAKPAPAFPDQPAFERLFAAATKPGDLQTQIEPMLKPIFDLLKNGKPDLEDFAEALAVAYPDMDDTKFTEALTRAMFVSEVWGRLSAARERRK